MKTREVGGCSRGGRKRKISWQGVTWERTACLHALRVGITLLAFFGALTLLNLHSRFNFVKLGLLFLSFCSELYNISELFRSVKCFTDLSKLSVRLNRKRSWDGINITSWTLFVQASCP